MGAVMYRNATELLKKWKEKKNRQPLILLGARQVGKTWLMKDAFHYLQKGYNLVGGRRRKKYWEVYKGTSEGENHTMKFMSDSLIC